MDELPFFNGKGEYQSGGRIFCRSGQVGSKIDIFYHGPGQGKNNRTVNSPSRNYNGDLRQGFRRHFPGGGPHLFGAGGTTWTPVARSTSAVEVTWGALVKPAKLDKFDSRMKSPQRRRPSLGT